MANEFKVKNGLIVVGDLTTSGTITINGALAATQSWVTSQAYLTSASLSGYATQSYVTSAIAALVNSAPAALDTLNELATALGNDASFSTTITNSIAGKLSLSGGTMTGLLTAPKISLTTTGNDYYLNLNGLTVTSIGIGETIWRNLSSFRFSDVNDWDYNSWAGLKFINSTKQIVLGVAGNVFTANNPQTGTLLLDRISTVYVNNTSQTVWHSGNLTNLNQLSNGPGYITSYTETDTLASVTGRGASTSTNISVNSVNIGTDATYGSAYRSVSFGYNGDGSNRILAANNTTDGMYFMAATGQGFNFRPNGGTANLVVINSSGNVGIGTTSPGARLNIAGALGSTVGGGSSAIKMTNTDTGNYASISAGIVGISNSGMEFSIDANRAMVISGAGNVGIGTTSPTQKLQVDGALRLTSNPSVTADGTAAYFWNQGGVGPTIGGLKFQVQTNGATTAMTIDDSQRVGIGTTTPDYLLQVQSSGNSSVAVVGASGYQTALELKGGDQWYRLISQPSANGSRFDIYNQTQGAYAFSIFPNSSASFYGNVGIGTTSPAFRLDVRTESSSGGATYVRFQNGAAMAADNSVSILLGDASDNRAEIRGTTVDTNNGFLSFYTQGSGNRAERMRITSGGNVGIGTTTPASKLHVVGPINIERTGVANVYSTVDMEGNFRFNASSGYAHTFLNNGSELVRIMPSGNVGIGTTSPETKLHVAGGDVLISNGQYYGVESTTGGNYKIAGLTSGNIIVVGAIDYTSAATIFAGGDSVNFTTGGVAGDTRIKISSSGNVGIGTTSPSYKLDVSGNARFANELYVGGVWSSGYGPRNSGEAINFWDWSGNVKARLTTNSGVLAVSDRKLSMGILDLNTNGVPTQFKIKTNIPWNYGGSDFTVNIKGFRYGQAQMVSLSIGWHFYADQFYNRNAISNGAWAPTISLAKSPDGYVIIHIPSPDYWAKLYVESVYSSNSADSYTSGWSWTDADLSDCTYVQTVPYKDLATNITGNSGTTSQTNFSSLTINSAAVATQAWVGSQGFLTSASDVWVNTTGDTMTGSLAFANNADDVRLYKGSNWLNLRDNWNNIHLRNNISGYGIYSDATAHFWRPHDGSSYWMTLSSSGLNVAQNITLGTNGGSAGDTNNILFPAVNGTHTSVPNGIYYTKKGNWGGQIDIRTSYDWGYSTDNAKISLNGAAANGITFSTGASVSGSTESMRIDGSGNVGVGTTSPESKLHVAGGKLTLKGGSSTDQQIVYNYAREYVNGIYNSSGHFRLQDNSLGGTVYQWDGSNFSFPNGNVGIGTTAPAYKLDVIGTARIGQNSNSSTAASLQITSGGNGYDAFVDFGFWDSFDASIWNVGRKGSTGAFFISDYSGGPELNRLTITPGGNIGIGTTSPSVKLDIIGSIRSEIGLDGNFVTLQATGQRVHYIKRSGQILQFTSDGANTYDVQFDSSNRSVYFATGNVGIGTTSPGAKLHVVGNTYIQSGVLFVDTIAGYATNLVSLAASTNVLVPSGDITIGSGASSSSSQPFEDFSQLKFDNLYSDTNRGPNKIVMHNNGASWIGGFGIHSNTVSYYTGGFHRWYRTTSQTSSDQVMELDPSGNLSVTGTFSASGYNSSNWNTAYSWGNHASAGYVTSSGSVSYATTAGTANSVSWSSITGKPYLLTLNYDQGSSWAGNTGGSGRNLVASFHGASGNSVITFGSSNGDLNLSVDGNVYVNEGQDILASRTWVTSQNYITSSGSISGNAATATTFSTGRTNYKGVTDNAVAGQLMWKNYGNNHTIFDASQGTSPDGTSVNNTNSQAAWTGSYPTLMGWNGSTTYGVRVDSARVADSASTAGALTSMNISQFTNNSGYVAYGNYSWTSPVFGQYGIKSNLVDNVLYSAADRFEVFRDGVAWNTNAPFNLNYDQSVDVIPVNTSRTYSIVLNTKGNPSYGIVYTEGNVYLSFYYVYIPDSVSGRVKDQNGTWRNINNWTNVANNGYYAVWRGNVPTFNYMVEIEITITSNASNNTWFAQWEYVMGRPGQYELGIINKAQDNSLWRNLYFRDSSNNVQVSIGASGLSTSQNLHISGTSSLYFPSYGGGFYMQDSSWIRTVNYKSIWTQSGLLGTDGGLTVGYGGTTPPSGGAIISGNVGIGTTSPSAKLTLSTPNAYDGTILQLQSRDEPTAYNLKINEVVNSGVVRWSFDMTNNSAYNNVLVLDRGNVGIGTSSPSTKLEVGNFLDAVTNKITVAGRYEYEPEFNFRLGQSGTNYDWIGAVISSGDDGNYNGKILFKTADANRQAPTTKMVIKANGNVGIGTTGPNYKLDVNGSINIFSGNSLRWGSGDAEIINSGYSLLFKTYNGSSLAEAMRINSAGKVSIGTTDTNSDKSDFTVYTGSGASIALIDDQVRMGGGDVNWGVALRSYGALQTYGQALSLNTQAGNYAVNVQPNGTTVAQFYQDYSYFPGLDFSISRINGVHASNYFRGDASHLVIGTSGTLYLNYGGSTTNITGTTYINGNLVWHAGNDGSGSGLDADTVDGVQLDNVVWGNARGTNDSITTNNNDLDKTGYYTSGDFTTRPSGVSNWMYIEHIKLYNSNTGYQKQIGYDTYDDRMWVRTKSGGAWSSWKQIWTSDSLTNLNQLTNGPGYITSSALSGYATTSYVTTQINNLIAGAPGALDTLDELAAALGDDSNFATTVTNSIAGKVSKSGDTMTGSLTIQNGPSATWDYMTLEHPGPHARINLGNAENGFLIAHEGTTTATFATNGNLTITGALIETSSLKLKENVETSEGNLEKVVNLRPVTYNKIGSQTTELGLIAEEVAEVYPEFVQYDENGDPVGVHYSRLTAALIGAVKELTNQVQELNKKING